MFVDRLKKTFQGRLCLFVIVYLLLALVFFWIIREDWSRTAVTTDSVNKGAIVGELVDGVCVEQEFTVPADELTMLSLAMNVWTADADAAVLLEIVDDESVLWSSRLPVSQMPLEDMAQVNIVPSIPDCKGKQLTLRVTSASGGVSVWYGNTRSAGRFDVSAQASGKLTVNGQLLDGELVMELVGLDMLGAATCYWPVALVLGVALCAAAIYLHVCKEKGKNNPVLRAAELAQRYSYLLKQLVMRDFKVKYKASVLGVLWSFLNPLLMTLVYFFVFSNLFHSNIENFIVYLMSGTILFNFFNESTSLGLNAIVGNASLITKVYMPKYIYPLSKVISAAINLVISMAPLLIVMLLTGVQFNKSLLLIPVVVLFLVCFATGMSMILSTMMVFFRDTQFLWGVLIMMWNFLTPIFYPESIIPAQFMLLYRLNPMYQICYFMRTIVLGGVSPTPITYLYCMLASFVPLALGILVFKKNQDKFALYL